MSQHSLINELADQVVEGLQPDRSDIAALAAVHGQDLWTLFAAAGRIRSHFHGRSVNACSIVNAKSGACSEDCAYCAQSSHHATNAQVYPLISPGDMKRAAESARTNRAKRFCIVTSGRGIEAQDDLSVIAQGIRSVRELGLLPCATLGTLTREQLAYLKDAGLHRYHHNIETSRAHFPNICTTHSFDERLAVIRSAQSIGLSVCSGGIFGMGETMQDRIDMAWTLQDMHVDSVPINFLMPVQGTPLEAAPPISPLEALHAIALFRFILPQREIRICAGRVSGLGSLHPLIFAAGADGFMIGNYLTKSGPDPREDLRMIRDLELEMA